MNTSRLIWVAENELSVADNLPSVDSRPAGIAVLSGLSFMLWVVTRDVEAANPSTASSSASASASTNEKR